jgi:hypothetical protein
MEHHFHFGIEHFLFIGMAAMVFRYFWKLIAAALVPSDGALGQFGSAMGGIAQ